MADEMGAGTSLVDRIKRILIEPNEEWDRIDAEPMTVGGIFTRWVFPLAAIPALCWLIGSLVFGWIPSLGWLIANVIIIYVFTTSGIFLYGLLIDALAPTFKGTANRVQAQKVSAFAATPAFVVGIVGLIPQLSILIVLGLLYALYLLYIGLPKLMKTPEDRTVPYIVTVIGAGILLALIAGIVIGSVSDTMRPSIPVAYQAF